ncbi:unnamed protein product [Paramecium pentaurelia]|uniref:Transmembrane protein n=1 Tax=Paramecium pentaurelia TaxID=43138 RepID=A0A8S1UDK3_9CILI|nr:unnamed protein product [Paramecium pentaurelia]
MINPISIVVRVLQKQVQIEKIILFISGNTMTFQIIAYQGYNNFMHKASLRQVIQYMMTYVLKMKHFSIFMITKKINQKLNDFTITSIKQITQSLIIFQKMVQQSFSYFYNISQKIFIDMDLFYFILNLETKNFFNMLRSQLFKIKKYSDIMNLQNQQLFQCKLIYMNTTITLLLQQSIIANLKLQQQTKTLILTFFNDQELYIKLEITPLRLLSFLSFQVLIKCLFIYQLNIAIFYFQFYNYIDIISTDGSFFKLFPLIKYGDNNLNQIQVQIETELPQQNALSSDFSISSNKENGVELRIQIKNQCFQLYPLMNSSMIPIQKNVNLKLYISDIFYGLINNLTLLKNSNIILNGPFQFQKELQFKNDVLMILQQNISFYLYSFHFLQQFFEIFKLDMNQLYMNWDEIQQNFELLAQNEILLQNSIFLYQINTYNVVQKSFVLFSNLYILII